MNYLVTSDLYVIDANTQKRISGPYKNEESAKRRIRDLKRKDAEAVKPIASPHAENMNAVKLVAASAYGKFNDDPGWINPRFMVRQTGCYPAISKHAYQR